MRKYFSKLTPLEAKRKGKQIKLRNDWEDIKVKIMRKVVFEKFKQNKNIREWLLQTSDEKICETNTWGDTIWGKSNGIGNNYLGIILMEVRDKFMKKHKVIIKKMYDIEKDNKHVKKTLRKIFKILSKQINPYVKLKLKIKTGKTDVTELGYIENTTITIFLWNIVKEAHDFELCMARSIIVLIHEIFHSIQIINDALYNENDKYKDIIEGQVHYQTLKFLLDNKAILTTLSEDVYIFNDDVLQKIIKRYEKYKYFDKIQNNIKKFYINSLFSGFKSKEDRIEVMNIFSKIPNVIIRNINGDINIIKCQGIFDTSWWRIINIDMNKNNFEIKSNKSTMIIVMSPKYKVKGVKYNG